MGTELEKKDSKNQALIDTVRKTIFPDGTDAELALFFHRCTIAGVNPLDQLIHPTKFRQPDGTHRVTFITSINLLRSKSDETKLYDGMDEPEYGDEIEQEYQEDIYENGQKIRSEDKTVSVPEWALVRVYRKDIDRPFIGKARWKEYYPGHKKGHQWRQRPFHMLAKCAEALARRLAFPDKLNQLYTEEEMVRATEELAGIENRTSTKPNVTPDQVKPKTEQTQAPEPNRAYRGIVQSVKQKKDKSPCFVRIGDRDYSTFSDTLQSVAMQLNGKMCQFTLTVKGKYTNLETIEAYVEPATKPASSGAVEDSESFATTLTMLANEKGIKGDAAINAILGPEFSCTIDTVPADTQAAVLEHFNTL